MAGKSARRLGLKDFLLRWSDRRTKQSPAEMLATLKAFAARQNARSKG